MNWLIRKVTSHAVWRWERSRRYSIRHKASNLLPEVLTATEGTDRPLLAVLAAPKDLGDATWAAWSWARFLRSEIRVWIVCDGLPPRGFAERLEKILPNAIVTSVTDVVAKCKHVFAFESVCPIHGRKLALILALQQTSACIYCDADVLAFNKPGQVLEAAGRCDRVLYMRESHEVTPDVDFQKTARKFGKSYDPLLNAGFLVIPQNALSVELAVQLGEDWTGRRAPWLLEQMIVACLVAATRNGVLDPDRYVISGKRIFWHDPDVDYGKIVCRHFTGPVRHVMYGRGIPALLRSLTG